MRSARMIECTVTAGRSASCGLELIKKNSRQTRVSVCLGCMVFSILTMASLVAVTPRSEDSVVPLHYLRIGPSWRQLCSYSMERPGSDNSKGEVKWQVPKCGIRGVESNGVQPWVLEICRLAQKRGYLLPGPDPDESELPRRCSVQGVYRVDDVVTSANEMFDLS